MKVKIFCFIFVTLLLCSQGVLAAVQKNVLLISSYHSGFPTFFDQTDGIRSVFNKHDISLDVEFMDSKRFYMKENIEVFYKSLAFKLSRVTPYDVVMAADDNAFSFVLDHQNDLFYKIPVVFLGVNSLSRALAQNSNPNVTGVVEAISMKETISLMTRLHPGVDEIIALVDGTPSGCWDFSSFNSLQNEFEPTVLSSISLQEYTFKEFAEELETLHEKSAVLLISAFRDKTGQNLNFQESLALIKPRLSRPVYHLWRHGIGQGVVGGKVICHFHQGRKAAQMVVDILGGKTPADIRVTNESPNHYMFDYRQLKRFDIDLSDIPVGAEIINLPDTLFQRHQFLFWGIAGISICLLFVTLVLSFKNFQRKQAEKKLKTDRDKLDQDLQKSEAMFRNLIENSSDWIWEIDEQGKYVYSSPQVEDILGYKPDDVIGKTPYELMPPDEAEKITAVFNETVSRKERLTILENVCLHKDGRHVVLETNGVPVLDQKGKLTGYRGADRDITERKKAEESLKDSERKLNTLFNAMTDAVFLHPFCEEGFDCFQVVNDTACERYEYTREEFYRLKAPDITVEIDARIHSSARNRKKLLESEHMITRAVHCSKSGKKFPVEINSNIIELDGRKMILALVRDVTEQKRLEEMMIQSEKMLSVGGLAAGMAHEINNPLAAMIQTANVMSMRLGNKAGIPSNQRAAEESGTTMESIENFMNLRNIPRMMEAITNSGSRIAKIVDNMLSFARKSDASVSYRNIVKLIDKSLELAATDYNLKKEYDFKNIRIVKDLQPDMPKVPCEGAKIQQVLLNILTNGAQAMQGFKAAGPADYAPQFDIRVSLEKDTDRACIEIRDNGPGMEEEVRKRIFDPFFTTKPVGIGTGLGLSVSYFIITENHRGAMDVVSEPGQGATFIIRLPLIHDHE